jgi:hypothetical protein
VGVVNLLIFNEKINKEFVVWGLNGSIGGMVVEVGIGFFFFLCDFFVWEFGICCLSNIVLSL